MRVVVAERLGGPEVLSVMERPAPDDLAEACRRLRAR